MSFVLYHEAHLLDNILIVTKAWYEHHTVLATATTTTTTTSKTKTTTTLFLLYF